MKTYSILFLISLFVFSSCCNNNQKNEASSGEQTTAVVSPSDEAISVDVKELLANPGEYDGKLVAITGMVTHVCKHSGKRLHLMGKDEKSKVRVEAGEVGKFERELVGSDVVIKGVFHKEVIDEEYLAKWAEKLEGEGKGEHMSHEEMEEEQGKMARYREMMGETPDGKIENYWVDAVSFKAEKL